MTNQSSIQYITTLLDSPDTLTDGDQSSIALFRQTFPYFVPVRYLAALEVHKKTEFAPEMLSAIKPYLGNWILFCDFLDAGSNARPLPMSKVEVPPIIATADEEPIVKVVDKKKTEVITEQEAVIPNSFDRNRKHRDQNRRDNRNQRRDNKDRSAAQQNSDNTVPNTGDDDFIDSEEISSNLLSMEAQVLPEPEIVADLTNVPATIESEAKEWVMEQTVQVIAPVQDIEASSGTAASWLERVNSEMETAKEPRMDTEQPVSSFLSSIQELPAEEVATENENNVTRNSAVLHEITMPLQEAIVIASPTAQQPTEDEIPTTPRIELVPAPLAPYKIIVEEPVVENEVPEPIKNSTPQFTPEELPVPIAPYKVQIAPDELPAVIVAAEPEIPEPVAVIPQKVVYDPLPELGMTPSLSYTEAASTAPYNVIVSAHDVSALPEESQNMRQNVAFGPGILMMELDSRIPAPPPTPIVEEIAIPVVQVPVAVIEEPMAVIEPEQPVIAVHELVETEALQQEGAGEVTEDAQRTGNKIAEEQLIYPIYTEDYFLHQGMPASPDIPDEIGELIQDEMTEEEKSLMVVMSFTEWLLHFKKTGQKQKEEKKDQKALKTMWQKEKLAAAMEEENEEIPENVFEMAVNSITKEDGLASESLADIYIKQGKYDKAIEMYRKLSLRNPKKNVYFARKIEEILKEKQS